jgi:hypothetical protein
MLIAIDPGKSGAIASYVSSFEPPAEPRYGVEKLAGSPQELAEQFKGYAETADQLEAPRMAILEEVSGFIGQKQPGSRMFTFGRGYGQIEGCLCMLKYQIIRMRPQQWQGALSVLSRKGEPKPQHKRRMRSKALDLFPHLKPTLDQADALLILYAHLQNNQ